MDPSHLVVILKGVSAYPVFSIPIVYFFLYAATASVLLSPQKKEVCYAFFTQKSGGTIISGGLFLRKKASST